MTTPHPKADLLIAIAQGKQMQSYRSIGDPWVDINPQDALRCALEGYPCRVKPETVTINEMFGMSIRICNGS